MAILKNRVKINKDLIKFLKSLLLILKHYLIAFFIIFSLYLLHFAQSGRFSDFTLEVAGTLIAKSLIIYEKIFTPILFLSEKLMYLKDLKTENFTLKLELAKLYQLESDIQSIKAENLALRKLLNVVSNEKYHSITARLLSLSLNPFGKYALVGAGSRHGIEVDQIVTNAEGLIGRIIQVSKNYSKVILINDFNSRVPVITLSTQEKGILSGNNNKSQIMYLQKRHSVKKGEKVITSGDGLIYPYGIAVAKILEVNEGEVLTEPLVNLCETTFVNIYSKNYTNNEIEK